MGAAQVSEEDMAALQAVNDAEDALPDEWAIRNPIYADKQDSIREASKHDGATQVCGYVCRSGV